MGSQLCGHGFDANLCVEHLCVGNTNERQLYGERVSKMLCIALRDDGSTFGALAYCDDANRCE